MLNDATALVLLRSAIAATAATVTLWSVTGRFLWAVVSAVGIGWLVGRVNLSVRARIGHPTVNVAISLVVPFVAYLPTEHLGGSGLVAAVTAGLVTGHDAPKRLRAEDRLNEQAVWRTLEPADRERRVPGDGPAGCSAWCGTCAASTGRWCGRWWSACWRGRWCSSCARCSSSPRCGCSAAGCGAACRCATGCPRRRGR